MAMRRAPVNLNDRSNTEVVRPHHNGTDVTGRPSDRWIIDLGADMPESKAALFELPFQHVVTHVKPLRSENARQAYRERWWLQAEARRGMRQAFAGLSRYLATSMAAKHRFFVWLDVEILPANLLIVFARQDDYCFGVLYSRAHELWPLWMGTWLGKGNDPRYTPTPASRRFRCPGRPVRSRGGSPGCMRSPRLLAHSMRCARAGSIRRMRTRLR